jgi:beta-phosphoglucomutase-like phosphatase (HAD superfamily)
VSACQLVIFDCDGVLVDSEVITNRVFAEMLGELGTHFTLPEMFERFVGRSMTQCCELIVELLQRPLPAGFVEQFHSRASTALGAELKTVAGIEAALDVLDAHRVPYCVASNGTREKMRLTLGHTGLLPRFEGKRFSVDQVTLGKPAPDLFLLAARTFDAAPAHCCVIEDTPTGVTAGVAAGMRVYGYCALMPAQRMTAAGAHRTFTSMSELPALILDYS